MNIAAGDIAGSALSPNQRARRIAARLERLGFNPYQSPHNRFLVLLGDAPGEIVELGKPLRGSRLFRPTALRRDIPIVSAFESFAAASDVSDFLFWNVGLTGSKSELGNLLSDVQEFNRVLNIQFSELRKRFRFECLLLVVHPRFDPFSGRFDLHAHFVCRMPEVHRESARRRLMQAFSKVDLPDEPIRNMAACATYMLWGIYPADKIESLPDAALADLWSLSQSRARLVRVGGDFAKFRRSIAADPTAAEARAHRARIQVNRTETADPRPRPEWADRLLTKLVVKRDGKAVLALLFEQAPKAATAALAMEGGREQSSSSATGIVTQEVVERSNGPSSEMDDPRPITCLSTPAAVPVWHRLCDQVKKLARKRYAALCAGIEFATAAIRSWLVHFIPGGDPPG